MPKVIHVKKARVAKPNHGIAIGESYYWWSIMIGGRGHKCYSKTRPKQSQLTNSEFWSSVFAIQEEVDGKGAPSLEDMESEIDSLVQQLEEIRDTTQEKMDNMPDSFRDGQGGERLQGRIDAMEETINGLQSIDASFDKPEPASEEEIEEAKEMRAQEIWIEVSDAITGISCE